MGDKRLPLKGLPASAEAKARYEVGFAKPPAETRFKPGHSGNPKGRPKGSRNAVPPLAEERIKKLIMEEAYRTVPVIEKGRRVTIPIMTAVLRAVAMNAAKGNNRAATLFTKLVGMTEAENQKLAADAFGSAVSYKNVWTEELERRKRLGIKRPDPVPHPDDIVLDARKMEFKINGPMTAGEITRYRLGAELLSAFEEANTDNIQEFETLAEGPEKAKLRKKIKSTKDLCDRLRPLYGPKSERTKDLLIRKVEDLFGVSLDMDEPETPDSAA